MNVIDNPTPVILAEKKYPEQTEKKETDSSTDAGSAE